MHRPSFRDAVVNEVVRNEVTRGCHQIEGQNGHAQAKVPRSLR